MTWFRRHIRNGSRLALLALAIQMVLSFGHFHSDAARAAGAVAQSVQLPANTEHTPHQHPADACAICAAMAMARTVVFATPPVLQLPEAVGLLQRVTRAEFAHLAAFDNGFQPRGPPLS